MNLIIRSLSFFIIVFLSDLLKVTNSSLVSEEKAKQYWEQFKLENGKVYSSLEEDAYRFLIIHLS